MASSHLWKMLHLSVTLSFYHEKSKASKLNLLIFAPTYIPAHYFQTQIFQKSWAGMQTLMIFSNQNLLLDRVQNEMQTSFFWLFQQIFSRTPTLMIYVMILLANYSVHSMGNNAALAAVNPTAGSHISLAELEVKVEDHKHPKFDSTPSSSGKTSSIGGGGGGKEWLVAGGTEGEEWFDKTESKIAWREEKMQALFSDETLHHETR